MIIGRDIFDAFPDNSDDASADGCERRQLTARVASKDGYVYVDVMDRGAGIAKSVVDRLFEPFMTSKEGGMGIDFPIRKKIISGHGGRLWASANEPIGTILSVTLPIVE